jgi:hypothetical protein
MKCGLHIAFRLNVELHISRLTDFLKMWERLVLREHLRVAVHSSVFVETCDVLIVPNG